MASLRHHAGKKTLGHTVARGFEDSGPNPGASTEKDDETKNPGRHDDGRRWKTNQRWAPNGGGRDGLTTAVFQRRAAVEGGRASPAGSEELALRGGTTRPGARRRSRSPEGRRRRGGFPGPSGGGVWPPPQTPMVVGRWKAAAARGGLETWGRGAGQWLGATADRPREVKKKGRGDSFLSHGKMGPNPKRAKKT